MAALAHITASSILVRDNDSSRESGHNALTRLAICKPAARMRSYLEGWSPLGAWYVKQFTNSSISISKPPPSHRRCHLYTAPVLLTPSYKLGTLVVVSWCDLSNQYTHYGCTLLMGSVVYSYLLP